MRYDTSAAQIEQIVHDVKAILHQATEVEPLTNRVDLMGPNEGAFQVEIFAYAKAATYEVFLEIQQHLLLQVMGAVSESGGHLAPPARAIYLKPKSDGSESSSPEFPAAF